MKKNILHHQISMGLIVLSLILCCISATATAEISLSGNEIDLLVGTPVGISEPLDARRTRHEPVENADFSSYLEDDTNYEVEFSDMEWSDSEDMEVSEDQAESTLLDLLSETEELESHDFSTDNDLNSTDKIETEFNL